MIYPLQILPRYGKIGREFFESVIYPNLGAKIKSVLVGPKSGIDTCAIKIERNQVLVATTDPISFIPELGPEESAWESVHLIASDLSTSGLAPQYALFDLNLPPSMKESDFKRYWIAISHECRKLGIAIVGGHTSRFQGLNSTVIGAGMMLATGSGNLYHASSNGRVGDTVIITKGAAIGTTGILARAFPKTIRKKLGLSSLKRAARYLKMTSVVTDALTASRAGVNAMHDATEGGVLSALYELASSSGTGLQVDLSQIPVGEETKAICEIFGIDPYTSLSEGTLIISCIPSKVQKVVSALREVHIDSAVVGKLVSRKQGIAAMKNGKRALIKYPIEDPYWKVYYEMKRIGMN